MAHSMLQSATLPLFSGLTLSNPHAYKVNDINIWDYMSETCGKDFMEGLSVNQNSIGYWDLVPKVGLMFGIGLGFYIYSYGYGFKVML